MALFHDVKLELVRPGPPHNQLLSPLTPYMALCGDGSPVTFHVDFEHRQLLNRLERLRYFTPSPNGGPPVEMPERTRQAEVTELGEGVGELLGSIRTLTTELARAGNDRPKTTAAAHEEEELVHLRLVVSGSELALIPFEIAVSPQAFPGEGLEFCLQANLPVTITRETRRGRPLRVSWDTGPDRPPRVLLVSAAPAGLSVPLAAHVQALRRAVEPWVQWDRSAGPGMDGRVGDRVARVKQHLRLLPDASIRKIYRECASGCYTHVHILAHGGHYEDAGEKRFGLVLCDDGQRQRPEVVSGKQLAKALLAEQESGNGRSHPLVVTLATCDSGNPGSVLVPGGSIAHDLHSAGVPWVIASQFPLTKAGSVGIAETLYTRLLRGDDPRQVLFEVRRQLYLDAERNHDWASVVAYASVSVDFPAQVASFFRTQVKRAIDAGLARADAVALRTEEKESETRQAAIKTVDSTLSKVKEYLEVWRARLPQGDSAEQRLQRAECYGIHGSTYKRIALLLQSRGRESDAREAYDVAVSFYEKAMAEESVEGTRYHWTATQYLSLDAYLDRGADAKTYRRALRQAKQERDRAGDQANQAWAHATLAELGLLSTYHLPEEERDAPEAVVAQVKAHCEKIVELMGPGSFQVASTLRQFNRYLRRWRDPRWDDIAQAAVDVLSAASQTD